MDDIALTIENLANGGEGIGRLDGRACFVPLALPGDTVRGTIVEQSGGVQRMVSPQWETRSPDYRETSCAVFGTCGGCDWLHFAYPAQAEWKQRIVHDCFARLGKIEIEVGWAEDASLRLGYRTRARFHTRKDATGFLARKTHEVVDIESCPLCHAKLNAALARLRSISYHHEVTICVNPEGDDVLVWTEGPREPLDEIFDQVNGPGDGRELANFQFDNTPVINGGFSQSSLLLNRVLRGVANDALGRPASLLDLYCGSGNFSLPFAMDAEVVGVDGSGPSIMAAHRTEFGEYRLGETDAMREAIREREWDAILLDPPRTGAKPLTQALGRARANRIVYVSCDPATLARDAAALSKSGWKVSSLTAVDMFPHTAHIEAVCLFERG